MNAGANGKEIKDVITKITYLDENNNKKTITRNQAKFKYRSSIFSSKNYIILETEIELKKGNKSEIEEKMNQFKENRKKSQPLEFPSAGSTFKRGKDFITAQLIDECGLKGHKIGDAEVSTKHAGFVINRGEATAEDILKLTEYIKRNVYEKFNKKIQLEMQVIGEESK